MPVITTNQKKLMTALRNAERFIAKGNSLPILQSLLLNAENGALKVSATNLEVGANFYVSAKVEQEGKIAVPAKIFSDFISNINDEKVSISTKSNVMTIDSERYHTQLLCFNPEEFPIIPTNKTKTNFQINAITFRKALLSVIDSVALSEARPELSGVYCNLTSQRAELAATDSYRLSEKIFNIKESFGKTVILPRNTVLELIRLFDNLETENISVSLSDNQLFVSNEDFELVSRLIDGKYPDYKRVIPEKFISLARFKKSELEKGIRTASIFSSSISDMKVQVADGEATILAKNSDKGEISATLACELKNEGFEFNANYNYLLDGLKAIDTEHVVFRFTGDGSPLVLKADGQDDFTYLIMPLRS